MQEKFNPVRNSPPRRPSGRASAGAVSNGINSTKIKILIGLGNPGKEYESTYHNVGALFIDHLNEVAPEKRFKKTNDFMNKSGARVLKIMKSLGVKSEDLLIAHDDSDLKVGKYKLSYGRGPAGHKGVESIINSLGTKNFWRLRIGIRREKEVREKAGDFVLKRITPTDKMILEKVFQEIFLNLDLKT